ncbi:MAG: threonylcarbamoyl-AMP synthase [Candidatus Aminicenantes bacterium]|nr:threonylcarbamoyl-AMP synthase [Candidatus Aminicenantes bacterium]
MDIIKLDDLLSPVNKIKIKTLLERDGIMIYPTDTLYGIGGNFFSLEAGAKIDFLKGRADMPYSAAVADCAMIERLTEELPAYFFELAKKIFPGKFTVLLKAAKSLDRALLKNNDKIGIRIPGHPRLMELLAYLEIPLISTSVNRSGLPPLQDAEQIKREFAGVELFIDAGPLPPSKGSTVLDLTVSPIRVIREGDDYEKIKDYLF